MVGQKSDCVVLEFQCQSTNGYEHSLFYPYNSFFIIILFYFVLFYPQSAFYPWSAVSSLHFSRGLQSAFYTDRPNNRFFDGKFIPEDKTIHWTCNKGKYVRAKAKTSEYFEGKHNYVRSKEHVVKTRNCIATKIILPFQRF